MPRRKGQTFRPRALARAEIQDAMAKLTSLRDRALLSLLFLTAARKSEALRVRLSDIAVEGDFIIVSMPVLKRRAEVVKKIPIWVGDPLAKPLVEYIERARAAGKERLFDITPQRVWQVLKSVGISPHELRHSRLTEIAPFLPSDVDLFRFAGWKLKGQAERYVHLRYEHLKDAVKRAALAHGQGLEDEEHP